jgi:hypothetical protein
VDACTVSACYVITAFAVSGPNLLLAEPVGFFGSERSANYFAETITQSISDRQRFIEANPFDRRRKPDIGYAPAASACERVDHVDACTVSACYVMIAFAISGPSLLLAEPAGFFGSERPLNCFIVRITQPTSDQLLFISTAHEESSVPGVLGQWRSLLRMPGTARNKSVCLHCSRLTPHCLTAKFASGMISSLRGVQLLIIAWWFCGVKRA